MKTRRSTLPCILALLVLTVLSGPSLPSSKAVFPPDPGSTTWQPFGPYTNRVVTAVYGDFGTMFTAFEKGEVDLTDWQVESPATQQIYGLNPDFFLTVRQDDLGIFDLEINHHASFLGIPMQENRGPDSFTSPSTKQPSAAGVEIRRALAHLLDKPDFVNIAALQGLAKYVDIQAPPAQGLQPGGNPQASQLTAALRSEDCAAHPWFTPCDAANPPVSAYNLSPDSLADPFHSFANHGWSGVADLRAACDHFVLAGINIAPSGASCADVAAGTADLVSGGQTVAFYIRTHPPRKAFGTIIFDAMNFLFDQNVAITPSCPVIGCSLSDIIFKTEPDRDDWNLYTGGWSLDSTPDHLYSLYHSSFASNACGGKKSTFAQNYVFYCSPAYDDEVAAGHFAASLNDAATHFANAAVIAHRNVMTIPVYSAAGVKYVALNGWDGLVNVAGHGFQEGFWSLLNMRCKAGYVASDPKYAPGGGDCSTIRRGFSQEVHRLSPFQASTLWDFEIIDQIYDSLLKVNPLTAGVGQQVIDWMTTKHTSSYDPVAQVTTQTWTLRNDLKWHDGVPVTAEDVAYTVIAFRDVPSSGLLPQVSPILSAVALNWRTVQVRLSKQSWFFEMNIGSLPIIPKHIWAPLCGDPPSPLSVCADPAFDPMAAGIMVGSGPRMCLNVQTGAVGGTCSLTVSGAPGTQDVTMGGKILLTAYDNYMRGTPGVAETSLHKLSWADRNNDGRVDIVDIADIALHFGMTHVYWNTGQNPAAPQSIGVDPTKVDISEIATVAIYFDHGVTSPFPPGALVGLGDMDPFF